MDAMEGRYCKICTRRDDNDGDPTHNASQEHRFNFLLYSWTEYRQSLVSNRHGVEVKVLPRQINGHLYNYSEQLTKGKHYLKITPQSLRLHHNVLEFSCTVKNIRRDSIILTSASIIHPYSLYSLYDPLNNLERGLFPQLPSQSEYTVIVKFGVEKVVIGSYKIPVFFNFQTTGRNVDSFSIARSIIVSIEEEVTEEAVEKSPFTNNDWPHNVEIFPPTKQLRHLNSYAIPSGSYLLYKFGFEEYQGMDSPSYLKLYEIREQMKPGYVTATNYQQFWHNLLWLEEMVQMMMLRRYNMENTNMKLIGGDMLELVVPGLAEKRPSVIIGDLIDIRIHDDHRAYRGVIKRVNDKTVDIAYVDTELLNYIESNPNIELDVRFVLGRLPLERQHQAVDQVVANQLVPFLFPKDGLVHCQVQHTLRVHDSEFFNKTIATNHEQKTAVLKILNHSSKGVPYIVFGPPGTGKTVTIVEAILQIMKKTTKKILVCAPANAACDMLTERLLAHCRKNELIRILSETVDRETINPHILAYTNMKDDCYTKVLAEELGEYRIVVATLVFIGGFARKYHPDVVFVDEAAQGCEPEVDCALSLISKGKQIVLAGDPKQLGPSASSKVAGKYGFEKSLLERLMDLGLYSSQNPNFITMLKLNFRSHSTILRLPNSLFYDDQLQAVSATSENDPLAGIVVFNNIQGIRGARGEKKNKPGQAVEFCSIISKECRQGRSPSYFNVKEMQAVLKYVEALTTLDIGEDNRVLPEHIGVVTPYIRQVYKIKKHLHENHFDNVEVGTTETFQGREKRVIIISTVRAQEDLLLYDRKYNLGFVKHEKRFNVAMTRAMSKLIVIGCAHVLATDTNWLSYIALCEDVGAFCGAPFAKRTRVVREEIMQRLSRVHMTDGQNSSQ